MVRLSNARVTGVRKIQMPIEGGSAFPLTFNPSRSKSLNIHGPRSMHIFAFLERLKLLSSSTITLSQSRYFTRSRCKCQSRTRSTGDPLSRLRTDDSPSEIDYSLREKIVLLRRNFSYTLCRFVSNECLTILDHGNISCQNHVGIHTLEQIYLPKVVLAKEKKDSGSAGGQVCRPCSVRQGRHRPGRRSIERTVPGCSSESTFFLLLIRVNHGSPRWTIFGCPVERSQYFLAQRYPQKSSPSCRIPMWPAQLNWLSSDQIFINWLSSRSRCETQPRFIFKLVRLLLLLLCKYIIIVTRLGTIFLFCPTIRRNAITFLSVSNTACTRDVPVHRVRYERVRSLIESSLALINQPAVSLLYRLKKMSDWKKTKTRVEPLSRDLILYYKAQTILVLYFLPTYICMQSVSFSTDNEYHWLSRNSKNVLTLRKNFVPHPWLLIDRSWSN